MLAQGVLTHPLTVTGYPAASRKHHKGINSCHDSTDGKTPKVFQKDCSPSLALEDFYEHIYCDRYALSASVSALTEKRCSKSASRLRNNIMKTAADLCERDGRTKCCNLRWNATPIVPMMEGEDPECKMRW